MLQFVGEDGNGTGDQRKVLLCHRVAAVGSHTQRTPLPQSKTGRDINELRGYCTVWRDEQCGYTSLRDGGEERKRKGGERKGEEEKWGTPLTIQK